MFKKLFQEASRKKIMILLGIAALGIIFVMIAEYTPTEKNTASAPFDESAYTEALEKRLEELISRVEGISDVKVMVTLAGSERYRYETGADTSVMTGKDDPVYSLGSSDRNEPVLTYVSAPDIKGVSVVCRGAGNAALRRKVIGLIAGALNLSANRIYVTE